MPTKDVEIILSAKEVTGAAFDQVQQKLKETKAKYEDWGRTAETQGRRIKETNRHVADSFKAITTQIGAMVAGYLTINTAIGVINEFQQASFTMRATFGDNADYMMAKAKELAQGTIYHTNEVAYAFTKTADSMERYGITGEKYLKLVDRAMDVGAAKSLDLKQSIDRLESAMRGEAEASEYLGVTLNDTYMKNIAFGGSLKNTWEKLDDVQKAQYRLNELLLQTEKYTGKAKEATENLSGAFKAFGNALKDYTEPALRATGGVLTSILNSMTELLNIKTKLRSGGPVVERKDLISDDLWQMWQGQWEAAQPVQQKISPVMGTIEPLDVNQFSEDALMKRWHDQLKEAGAEQQKFHDGLLKQEQERIQVQTKLELEFMDEQEKLNAEQLRQQEELNRKLEEKQRHFYERMHDITADFTYQVLDGQIKSWRDAWNIITDYVKRAIAELVAYAITKPIVVPVVASFAGALGMGSLIPQGVGGGDMGDIGGMNLGLGEWASSPMFGTTALPAGQAGPPAPNTIGGFSPTWGQGLGYAGAAYSAYSLYQSGKTQSRGANALSGAGQGAMWGTMISPGVGTVVGAVVGGIYGAITGGQEKHPPRFGAKIGFSGGEAFATSYGSGEYADTIAQLQEQLQATYGPQVAALKETTDYFDMSVKGFTYKNEVSTRRDIEDKTQIVLDDMAKKFESYMKGIARKIGFDTAEELMTAFSEAMSATQSIGGAALEQAFTGGGFDTFKDAMRLGVYESIKDGMIQAFIDSETYKRVMAPTMLEIEAAFDRATGPRGLNAAKFERYLSPILADFTADLQKLQPMFSAYEQVLGQTSLYLAGGSAIPYYQHGIDYVPRTGPAIVHQGERVVTADENRRGGSAMGAVININVHGSVVAEDLPTIIGRGLEEVRLRKIGRSWAYTNLETVGLDIS